jgi:hypothetical protein
MITRSSSINLVIFTAGLVLFQTRSHAQQLEQQDILPPLGATWHMRALQVIPPLPADDIPVVWPFADLMGNDVFGVTWSMIEPGDVPGGGSYPTADRVLHKVPDNDAPEILTYLDVQVDKCLEVASNTPFISNNFDPGALHTAYPLQYEGEVEAAHCYTSVSATGLTPFCGNTSISFEKIGTLQLNFGQFENARLVRTRRSNVDQLNPTDSSLTETLTWYRGGSPYPLLQFVTVYYANGNTSRSGYILDPSSVVGVDERTGLSPLSVFPVPSDGLVNFQAPDGGLLSIISADARLVHEARLMPSSTAATIDLGMLPIGAYQAILREERGFRTAALIIAR